VIMAYAARHTGRVRGLVTWSTPLDMLTLYRERHSGLIEEWRQGRTVTMVNDGRTFALGPDFPASIERTRPLELLSKLDRVPLLIIHGAADETVPPSQADLLSERYPGPWQKHIVPDASHRLLENFDHVGQLTRNWIRAQLGGENGLSQR